MLDATTVDALPKSVVLSKARELIDVARQQGSRKDDLLRLLEGL